MSMAYHNRDEEVKETAQDVLAGVSDEEKNEDAAGRRETEKSDEGGVKEPLSVGGGDSSPDGESEAADDILKIVLDDADEDETPNGIIELSRPVSFDGDIIKTIDLRGLEDISEKKARKIRKIYDKISKNFTTSPETTEEYAIAAASFITGYPTAFFEHLPHKDIIKIRTRVINFFFLA